MSDALPAAGRLERTPGQPACACGMPVTCKATRPGAQSRYRNSPTPFGANFRFFSTSVKCATDKRIGTALGYANRRNYHGEPSKRITRKRRIRASIKR